jgi:phosphopantothenoylcysteine decarboxylase
VPFTNRAHAAHPAFAENVARLRSWGVEVLFNPDPSVLPDPGSPEGQRQPFPWRQAIEALDGRVTSPPGQRR